MAGRAPGRRPPAGAGASAPPPTRRDPVVDVLHGVPVEDPYRWLEDAASPETRAWIEAQNRHTDAVVLGRPEVARFRERIAELLSGRSVEEARERGGRLFYTSREPGEEGAALRVRATAGGPGLPGGAADRTLVDPNGHGGRHPVALDWWYPSPRGTYVAYGLSADGSEDSVLHVVEVATGRVLPERIPRTRHSSVAWHPDERGFYYTRYPERGEVAEGDEYYIRRVMHHRLGDDPARDPVIFEAAEPRTHIPHAALSDDGRFLVLWVHEGWRRTDVWLAPVGPDGLLAGPPAPVVAGLDALFVGEMRRGRLVVLTNHEAPNFRIAALDPADPDPGRWVDLVPEAPDRILSDFAFAPDGRLVVAALKDAKARLFVSAEPASEGPVELVEVELPAMGTLSALAGFPGREVTFTFDTFEAPPAVFRLDVARRRVERWIAGEAPGARPGSIEVRQVFYASRDGTRVPMFVLVPRGFRPDGRAPTVLTGYGGFGLARTPAFSAGALAWVEAGGVFAVANLRGGSEYGERWHRAGMLEKKQNVFDDFIAAAEFLIREGYTDREHLGAYGRSNGGLLVGAALTQRPDLFRAVVCGVPLLDMVRYHRFLIASTWIPEYGTADDPEEFPFLYAYSPYHRVREGTAYPAVYFFAAMSDGRVDALHARKMAARLQHATSSDPVERPVVLRLEFQAGHGVGKPLSAVVAEEAEWWGFLAWQLGLGAGPAGER